MTISMRDVRITNLPRGSVLESFIDRINIQLKGELKVIKASATAKKPILSGRVELKLRAELPQILLAVPGIQQVIDSRLLHSLSSLESDLTAGIIDDYHEWAQSKAKEMNEKLPHSAEQILSSTIVQNVSA